MATCACPIRVSPDTEGKRRAVATYSSQIKALEAHARAPDLLLAEILAPERYWRLAARGGVGRPVGLAPTER
ncbi:MAG: hypothetical protein ACRDYX_00175 [Egibacteraceae bacterium]